MTGDHPAVRPARPFFSSGPCAKRPGWTSAVLDTALLGRSHRSGPGKTKLKGAIDRTRKLLGAPDDFRCAIVPASDTGAVEIAMWSMLGARPVDVFAWESFGEDWVTDAVKELQIAGARAIKAPYGALPDLSQADPAHDIVFTWNGTTGGVRVPDADWIAKEREGIVICDATSAAFAMDLAWDKLDVVTFSWQKVLGGEAAHGMMLLSPRAVARLESYVPPRPLPKLFRLTRNGKLNQAIFEGETINTPSMLALEDYLDALDWAEGIGGLTELKRRVQANYAALSRWVEKSDWIDFLAADERYRSPTSVCLKIVDPTFAALGEEARHAGVKRIADLLEAEAAAFDVAGHRNAPPGLRIWCGATVETAEIEALTPWLDWAWKETRA